MSIVSADQANSFSGQVQSARANARAQNNAVMDSFHQAVQEKRTSDYIQGAGDTFKDLKSIGNIKDAITANMAKYQPSEATGTLKSAGIIGTETAETLSKGAGALGGALSGGLSLFKDIKSGDVAGANLAQQASNITDIAGGALTALAVVPGLEPVALVGAGLEAISALTGTAGDVIESGKSSVKELADAASEISAPKAAVSLAQSGQLETGRSE